MLWVIGIALGGSQAWIARHTLEMDGVCFLDLADAWIQCNWPAALNGLWSPLYAWLLAIAMVVLKPTWEHEFAVVHLVNFFVYIGALFAFHFFLMQWIRAQRAAAGAKSSLVGMADWALISIGYSLFFWSSLLLITVARPYPDLCVATFLYLILGVLIRINSGAASYSSLRFWGCH
jgi:hypothetical protein